MPNMIPFYNKIRADIVRVGWSCVGVFDDNPPFTYSIGLTEKKLPEIVCFGINPHIANQLINVTVLEAWNGVAPKEAQVYDEIATAPTMFRYLDTEDAINEYLVQLGEYYSGDPIRDDIRVVQMIYPDRHGLWPWESGCNDVVRRFNNALNTWSTPEA